MTGAPVREIVQSADGVRCGSAGGASRREISAAYAIVATPADVTRAIVRDLPVDTAEALGWIPYGPCADRASASPAAA